MKALLLILTSMTVLPMQKHIGSLCQARSLNERRWEEARIRSTWLARLDKAVDRFRRDHNRYVAIERLRVNGMPAAVIFAIHGRESSWSFGKHLHEGSPLTRRTRWVPQGRPLKGKPPFTFIESAEDALYILKRMDRVRWQDREEALKAIEAYNGTGYLRFHPEVPSPYLWSGTTIYTRGKYVADGRFSKSAVDQQLGCAAILKRMRERGVEVGF